MDSNLSGIPGAASVAGFLANQIGKGFRLAGQTPRMLKNTPRALVSNPKRILNPFSNRGGLLYGMGIQKFGPSLGLDQETVDGLDILAGGTSIVNLPFLLQGGDQNQDPDAKARRLGYADAADQVDFLKKMRRRQAFIGPPSPDFIGPRVPDYAQASYNARVSPSVDKFGNPPLGPYDHEFKLPSPDDPVLSLSSDGKGLVWVTRAQRDASLQPPVAQETEEKNSKSDPELMALYEKIKGQLLDPRIQIGRSDPFAPFSDKSDEVNPPLPEPVSSTPNNMQSELLQEATTMRRAKEMKELGITGGDEAMNKGSAMHTWLSTHGELADNLIRDKRMREVRVAREFDRDLPTDARGLDGQMGNFEAFNVYS